MTRLPFAVVVLLFASVAALGAVADEAAVDGTLVDGTLVDEAAADEVAKVAEAIKRFDENIAPVLVKSCQTCHNADDAQGGLNLAAVTDYAHAISMPQVWVTVLERLQADEMPPKEAERMMFGDRQALIGWAREHGPAKADCGKLASDRTVSFYTGNVMSRRLNRDEYNRTLSDLFGIAVDVGSRLPADAAGGGGFDTTGDTLYTSSLNVEKYIEAADELMQRILPDAPVQQDVNAVAARERLLSLGSDGVIDNAQSDAERARRILQVLLRRAFRRSVTSADVDRFMAIFEHSHQRGDAFDSALRLTITGLLISPHFLFLVEPEPAQGGTQRLGSFPLASRLSYFLWSSMPDETLLFAAESGRLLEPDGYLEQVRRMLRDPKARSLGERFVVQWLEIDKLGGDIRPDAKQFPEFDDPLAVAMKQEVVEVFNRIVREDRSLLELIDSDYSLLNQRLADHYEIPWSRAEPAVQDNGFQVVRFDDAARGGITGMAAVHTLTSYPLRTSPVLRGRYVLEILLGQRVPPPPPNVPPLDSEGHQVDAANMRLQLERHRQDPACAGCHDRMDPLGFSLESFDNLGRQRTEAGGKPIDVSAKLPDGFAFEGPSGLKQVLIERKDQVMRQLAKKLLGYALGRELNEFDECVVRDSMTALEANGYKPSILIEVIATSLPFKNRYYPQ